MKRHLMTAACMLALAACGGGDAEPNLLNIKQPRGAGPDEFSILPTGPLQMPEDMAALPEPTPGGGNLTDPDPEADVARALGGNAEVLARASTDGALISAAGRYGVDANIRAALAAEDLEFRRDNDGRLLERVFNTNVYYRCLLYTSDAADDTSEV